MTLPSQSCTMILLVGDQPAPNVLPLHHYAPDKVILVHTNRTQGLARRILSVIGSKVMEPFCQTDAYRVDRIRQALEAYLEKYVPPGSELIFNLTGGTKTMEYAALDLARQKGAKAFYYQTDDNQGLIHPYHFESGKMVCEPSASLDAALTLDQHLRLYMDSYARADYENDLERNVFKAIQSLGDDYESYANLELTGISGNVEVDWAIRYRNTLAMGEVKYQVKKNAIDQINGVAGQTTLGTYTKKFLVSVDNVDINNLNLAQAYKITTIVLPSGRQADLSSEDQNHLVQKIRAVMEPKP